jgi:hemolysin D
VWSSYPPFSKISGLSSIDLVRLRGGRSAFEFTKYGSLEGVVQWVGADAVKHEQLGQVFPVRIVLKQTKLPVDVDGNHPEIRIGMSVTADVAIGKRKAYEYFLGPLLKYKNESLRER